MPLYLAHGTADNVVPEAQSRLFYDALVRQNSSTIIVEYLSVTGAGHDYNFWEGQLENVFEFIDQAQ
jgi:dipeptidyl aminopeptidase/acylaminoacyl peptidase